jgi:alkanesulfonate monooxygenase SsuD/methylene tetrahydromethanopterin reductase-like flavin-dependent oxidoreductase (luciferase family)
LNIRSGKRGHPPKVAAHLGLPYAFASHFAPGALIDAIALYRREFRPSEQLAEPHAIAGVNVIAADSDDDAALSAQEAKELLLAVLKSKTELSEEAVAAQASEYAGAVDSFKKNRFIFSEVFQIAHKLL